MPHEAGDLAAQLAAVFSRGAMKQGGRPIGASGMIGKKLNSSKVPVGYLEYSRVTKKYLLLTLVTDPCPWRVGFRRALH